MTKSWILVADAARARLFETAKGDRKLVEIACYAHPDLRGAPHDNPGRRLPRRRKSTGPSRYAIGPDTSRRDKRACQFAQSLTAALENGYSHHRYERLFLIAPPRLLCVLREGLGEPFAKGLAGEIGNNLVELSPDDLLHHLRATYPHDFHGKRGADPALTEGRLGRGLAKQ